jgi:phosphoserine aminotransferase
VRVYNFSAGPAAFPEEVIDQAAGEMHDWHGHGMGVMEMSHRSKEFLQIAEETEKDLRELMNIPDNYKVLFLQGGATGQFSAIPMNLAKPGQKADYILNGSWGKKAAKEAKKYVDVNIAAEADPFNYVPSQADLKLSKDAAYVHITNNETIEGLKFDYLPDTGDIPLVGDASSMILSEPIDVSKFGVLYAGAQKNIGPAGLTIVIVRDDLLDKARDYTPMIWHWGDKSIAGSMLNTPPTYSWYLAGLMCKWLLRRGGVEEMQQVNQRKAKKLYDYIDSTEFYNNDRKIDQRSVMNIVFTLSDAELDKKFLVGAEENGLMNLKGHRSVGGMRASIYNAMSEEGVNKLIKFMKGFEEAYGE